MLLSKAIYTTFKLYIYNLNRTHDLGFAGVILYCYRYIAAAVTIARRLKLAALIGMYFLSLQIAVIVTYRSLFSWMHLKYIYSLSICLLLNFWWVCNKISIITPIYLNYAFNWHSNTKMAIALETDPYSQWKALIYGEVTESPLRSPAGFAAGRLILR